MSLITEWRAACTVQSVWAPSGDLFLTASTYPRMKVDNLLRVFDYEGKLAQEIRNIFACLSCQLYHLLARFSVLLFLSLFFSLCFRLFSSLGFPHSE
ncbi:gyf domain-containing, partial [Cystoisospora suis]